MLYYTPHCRWYTLNLYYGDVIYVRRTGWYFWLEINTLALVTEEIKNIWPFLLFSLIVSKKIKEKFSAEETQSTEAMIVPTKFILLSTGLYT